MKNLKNQIKTLKEHINKLMIIEKHKHLYFINVYFKKKTYDKTTRNTREQYIKEFLNKSLSNYIASKIIYKNKESYKILINNYEKELIIKMCLRIADTIGTATRIYIKSTDKNESNINYYLKKLLNNKPKTIIKNKTKLNYLIYSKDNLNKLNLIEQQIKNEKDNLKKQVLINQKNELINNAKQNIFKIIKKRQSFYKYDIEKFNKINQFKELNKKNNIKLSDKEIENYVKGINKDSIYKKAQKQLIKKQKDYLSPKTILNMYLNDLEIDERIENEYNKEKN